MMDEDMNKDGQNDIDTISGKTAAENHKKKHKGLKIALISVAAVLIVLGGLFIWFYNTHKDYVQNKWALMTKDDTEYFHYVLDRNIEKLKVSFEEKLAASKNIKCPESFGAEGSIDIGLSKELGQYFLSSSFAGIEKAGFKYVLARENGKDISGQITPFYGNGDIISVAAKYEKEGNRIFAAIPSYDKRVIELTGFFEKNADEIEKLKERAGSIINAEGLKTALSKILDGMDGEALVKLINVIYGRVNVAELKKEVSISVNGLETQVNVLSFKLSKKECTEIVDEYAGMLSEKLAGIMKDLNIESGYDGEDILEYIKKFADKTLSDAAISLEGEFYADDLGDIVGGSLKPAVNETKVKIDCLGLKDEDNADKGSFAIDIYLNGIKLAGFMNEYEKKDSVTVFNAVVKPGSMVDALVKGASGYRLCISGSFSGDIESECNVDITLSVKNKESEEAHIRFVNSFKAGAPEFDLDTGSENLIDIYELHTSDYIDLGKLGRQMFERLDGINDENLNNFIEGFLRSEFDIDLDGLRELVDSPMAGAGNALVKDWLKKFLGIVDPYEYGSLSEKPKMQDEKYVYSWDILKDVPVNTENIVFKVYDHFQRPEEYEVDIEQEKIKFLEGYAAEVYERAAEENDVIEMGDSITFDAALMLGSMVVEKYSYSDNPAVIGQYEYGDGIDDMLLGMKVGESKELDLTLDDRFGSFAGFSGTFKVTVRSLTKTFRAEWSDRFIVEKLGYASLEECENILKENAEKLLPEDIPAPDVEKVKEALFDEIAGSISAYVFSDEQKAAVDAYKREILGKNAARSSLPPLNIGNEDITKFALAASIAYGEGIALNETELEDGWDRLAKECGLPDRSILKNIVGYMGERYLADEAIERKVWDILYSKANVVWD